MKYQQCHTFEGTLVAAGWDKSDSVSKSSLYTQEDEDIMLDHGRGISELKPFLNNKVKISGVITSTAKDRRVVLVKRINTLPRGFTKPVFPLRDEFGNLIMSYNPKEV